MKALYILIAVLIFGTIIFVHELGHYLTARLFRVTIKEFAIGMGPTLISYTSKKTGIVYSLRMLPFGGFVSMVGEDEEADDPNALSKKPAWQRFIIVAAGAFMNLLTGILLTVVLVSGMTMTTNTVAGFQDKYETSSKDSGLMVGDTIVAVNHKRVHIAYETVYYVMHDGYRTIDITVIRDGEKLTFPVSFPTEESEGVLFGTPDMIFYADRHTFFGTLKHSFYYSILTVRMIWDGFGDLLTGRIGAGAISGPLGITSEITNVAASGNYRNLLYLAILISMNVGIVNWLPIPAMDGGRLVFILWEMITRKPVPQKIEGMIHGIGLMILLLLMLVVTAKDITGLF